MKIYKKLTEKTLETMKRFINYYKTNHDLILRLLFWSAFRSSSLCFTSITGTTLRSCDRNESKKILSNPFISTHLYFQLYIPT